MLKVVYADWLLRGQRSAAVLLFLIAGCIPLFAGFNDTMDATLAEERLTLGSASWMLMSGAGLIDQNATGEEALSALAGRIDGVSRTSNTEITLGEFSWYLMEVFEMKGGLMYRLFPGPRYALRELRFREFVQGSAYAAMPLSGERAFRILGRVLASREAQK